MRRWRWCWGGRWPPTAAATRLPNTAGPSADRLRTELGTDPGPALRELQRAVLGDRPLPALSPPPRPAVTPPAVPAQLPADVPGFAGRTAHLAGLDAVLATAAAQAPTAVVITAVVRHGRGRQDRAGGALGAPRRRPVPRRAAVREPARLRPGGQRRWQPADGGPRVPRRARRAGRADPGRPGRAGRALPQPAGRPADAGRAGQRPRRRAGPPAAARRARLRWRW